jgi:isopentenyldiphosphate isomerase
VTGELLEIVDADGRPLGTALRSVAHRDPSLIHRVVHVLVREPGGEILLQRRSLGKRTAPGKWDMSVGGHAAPGESDLEAARRETAEELGLEGVDLAPLYTWTWQAPNETERVATFALTHAGPFPFCPTEIDEVRFWSVAEIEAAIGSGALTSQFEAEYRRFAPLWPTPGEAG